MPTTTPTATKRPAKAAATRPSKASARAAVKAPAKSAKASVKASAKPARKPARKRAPKATPITAEKAKAAGRAAFPAIDLSRFDVAQLGKVDLAKFELAGVDGEQLATALRDAAYITIGFGVLAIQQAQVRRREIVSALSDRFGTSRTQMDDLLKTAETRLSTLDGRLVELEAKLDQRVDTAVAQLESKLPEQAATLLGQAHGAAKAARTQVRGFIRTAA